MNKTYSNVEILFLIVTVTIGFTIISIPKNVAEVAGTGGWFTLLLTTILCMFMNYMFIHLAYSNDKKTLYDYSENLVGKTTALIIICIYTLHFFLTFTFILRTTSEVIKHSTLLKTPSWILTLTFLLVVAYALNKGLKTIILVCEIYGIIFILSAILGNIFIATQGDIYNILPIFDTNSIGLYIKGIFTGHILFSFIGIDIISYIALDKKKNKNICKYTFWITGFIGIIYILIFETSISIMGVHEIVQYKDSVIATIRRVELPFLQFLGRLDGIFITSWLFSIFCTAILYSYGAVYFIGKILKDKINRKVIIFIVMILSFIFSEIPKTVDKLENILTFISYFALLPYFVIPGILVILNTIKKNQSRS